MAVGPTHSIETAGCCRPGCTSSEILPAAGFAAGSALKGVAGAGCTTTSGAVTPPFGAVFVDSKRGIGAPLGTGTIGCGATTGADGNGNVTRGSSCPRTAWPSTSAAKPVPEIPNSVHQ